MTEQKLVRGIGRGDLIAICINTIIGAGIFGVPSQVQALIGSYSLFAFVACSIVIGLIVLCYAEVASRFTSTGGPYLYARESLGPVVAFEVGWLYWIVRITTFAANCNLFLTYVGFFWPSVANPPLRIAAIAAVVLTLSFVNFIGVRQASLMTNIFTVGKLLPILVFIAVGLFFLRPENFTFDTIPQYSSFSNAVLLMIYAYVGFEVAVIPAGEAKDPKKDFPIALLAALCIVVVIYVLVQVVCIGTLPGLAESKKPLADAAGNFMGPLGAATIVGGALISILGNLNVGMLGSSRILFAMGERRELPTVLAQTHSRFKTPYVALGLNAVVIFILTIESSFLVAVAIATITRLLIYATTCISLPIFRNREVAPNAGFLNPFGIAPAILSLALIAWLLTNVDFGKEGWPVLVLAVVGLIIYFIGRPYRQAFS
ncbi:MAG: amino acid permease [Acidobacteriota bacterium]